ncbi:hypothetical protein [Marinitenerispora sediminis]|uniref:Uncharacterized protein n=1 Tax=Marinitenerispora sediminis TaxID=1931232 RepID=A0A368T314_9ACTN|nr:hypothetical protein [Marinitenerispora sediminis]RCV49366.1 hypothetical protein DEF28_20995 [Marinitenerispora sediminis]RCV55985.1 hypothetical protein DEF23_13360 [Marinitenerispora sediminis]RCV56600.1 hypothetical protein DEF24_16375 [Marinitenerispora sediminis]
MLSNPDYKGDVIFRGASYDMSIDDSLRRICNQAFFDRINVDQLDGGDIVDANSGEPLDTLLDPSVHAAALTYEARLRAGEDVKPADAAGLNIPSMVGHQGIEP